MNDTSQTITGGLITGGLITGGPIASNIPTSNFCLVHSNGTPTYSITDLTYSIEQLSERLAKVERRLAILTPDPKRLEKYQALYQAYDHYCTLDALLTDGEE